MSTMAALPPLMKAGLQSGSIMTIADFLTQVGIEGKSLSAPDAKGKQHGTEAYDSSRTLRWTVAGLTIHGPYFLFAFGKIDKAFAGATPGFRTVMMKTATAQFAAFPPYLVLLFGYLGAIEGRKLFESTRVEVASKDGSTKTTEDKDSIVANVAKKCPEAFAGGCVFWPIVNTINFGLIPPTMRVPYVAGAGSVWNCFLSWLNAKERKE